MISIKLNSLNDMQEIMRQLSEIVSRELDDGVRICNKRVSEKLEMPYQTLATQIVRGTIPYREIILFCAKRGILMNEIFCNQKIGIIND